MENSMEGVFHNQPAQAPNDTVQFTLPLEQNISLRGRKGSNRLQISNGRYHFSFANDELYVWLCSHYTKL